MYAARACGEAFLQVRLGGSDRSTLHERLGRRTVMRLCEHSEACACGAELVSEMFSPLGDARHPARVPWISLAVLGHSSTPSPSGGVGSRAYVVGGILGVRSTLARSLRTC